MTAKVTHAGDKTPMTWPEFWDAATARNRAYWAGLSPEPAR